MFSGVSIQQISNETALAHWHSAGNASAFTHPEILSSLTHEVHWWLVSQSGGPYCLWPVCLDRGGRVSPPEFGYYVGPFRLKPEARSPRKRLLMEVAVQRQLLSTLSKVYGPLRWSTMPDENDLRPWLWYESGSQKTVAIPRHTAVVQSLDKKSKDDVLRSFSKNRQQCVRRAITLGAIVLPHVPVQRLMDLYVETLAANDAKSLAIRRLDEVEALYHLATTGYGFILPCGLEADQVVRSVFLVLLAKGRAYEVLGASDASWRRQNLNAYGRWRSLLKAQETGASCYDFNGANSLQRALDKHSYGAEVAMYFDFSS